MLRMTACILFALAAVAACGGDGRQSLEQRCLDASVPLAEAIGDDHVEWVREYARTSSLGDEGFRNVTTAMLDFKLETVQIFLDKCPDDPQAAFDAYCGNSDDFHRRLWVAEWCP